MIPITPLGKKTSPTDSGHPTKWPKWRDRAHHDDTLQAVLLARFLEEDDRRQATEGRLQ